MAKLTQKRLKELMHYDPLTGLFTRLISMSNSVKIGDKVGAYHSGGYLQTRIHGKLYYLHRLVWFYIHGVWPREFIDHINGIKDDNRLSNLREATRGQNGQNILNKKKNSSSKYIGVHLCSGEGRKKPWRANIMVNKVILYLGHYYTEEEARDAVIDGKRKHHSHNTL